VIREPATLLSDDADQDPHYALTVCQGNNGDYYLSVMPAGDRLGPSVRVSTSGGASCKYPGVTEACRLLWEAISGERQDPATELGELRAIKRAALALCTAEKTPFDELVEETERLGEITPDAVSHFFGSEDPLPEAFVELRRVLGIPEEEE